jgi:hypothetical protein
MKVAVFNFELHYEIVTVVIGDVLCHVYTGSPKL